MSLDFSCGAQTSKKKKKRTLSRNHELLTGDDPEIVAQGNVYLLMDERLFSALSCVRSYTFASVQ